MPSPYRRAAISLRYVFLWGGALSGPSTGLVSDLTGIALYGLVSIAIMILAGFLCEKILLPHFNNTKEIVQDHNMGTAFVEAGLHIANGLIVLAIFQVHWFASQRAGILGTCSGLTFGRRTFI